MRLVLLGDPVGHSLSPRIHTAALEAAGIDGSYEARKVDAAGLRIAVDEIRYGALDGANVTMPHKQLAFTLCDAIAESALWTGSVNTLTRGAGNVTGHNTDVAGVRYGFEAGGLPGDTPVLVLGAGGAAAAVLVACADRPVSISARRAEAAAELTAVTRVAAAVVPWGEPVEGAVVVNATPLGMHGEALPDGVVEAAAGLLEMPYASGTTLAEAAARSLGIPVASGLDMLLGQAFASFELWTGLPAPREAMIEAAQGASQAPA